MAKLERNRWRLAAVAVVGLTLTAAAGAHLGPKPAPMALRHVVEPGDTLWTLATRVGAPSFDRRELVMAIQEVNGFHRATLQPGQALVVPIGEASVRDALRDPDGFRQRAVIATGHGLQTSVIAPTP